MVPPVVRSYKSRRARERGIQATGARPESGPSDAIGARTGDRRLPDAHTQDLAIQSDLSTTLHEIVEKGRDIASTSRPFSWHWRLRRHSDATWSFSFDGFGGMVILSTRSTTPSTQCVLDYTNNFFGSTGAGRRLSASFRDLSSKAPNGIVRSAPLHLSPIRNSTTVLPGRRRRVYLGGQQCLHLRRAPVLRTLRQGRAADNNCRNWAASIQHSCPPRRHNEKVSACTRSRAKFAVGASLWWGCSCCSSCRSAPWSGRVRPDSDAAAAGPRVPPKMRIRGRTTRSNHNPRRSRRRAAHIIHAHPRNCPGRARHRHARSPARDDQKATDGTANATNSQ